MKKVMAGPLRWLLGSAPGVALLVIAAGVGGAYAATDSGSGSGNNTVTANAPAAGVVTEGPLGGVASSNLSDSDRKALEAFGRCMRDKAPQPGSQPSDPRAGHDAFTAAFDACKANLTDAQRTQFEARQAQEQKFRTCMGQNGAPAPPVPGKSGELPPPPSGKDLQALRKAQNACADQMPEGGGMLCLAGGPHGPGGPPPGFGPMGGPPPPPPGAGNGSGSGSKQG